MNAPPARKSKLEPYAHEIISMRNRGVSEQGIVEFLETERGLKITRQNLNYFLKRQKNNNSSDDTALEDVEDEKLEQERIRLTTAKQIYNNLAEQLDRRNFAKLKIYEKIACDLVSRLSDPLRRTRALANYYASTSRRMDGEKLSFPEPLKMPQS